mgnify:CR=1 FL=1
MQLVQAQAYRKQYGFNAIFVLPVNLYGPGDNFNSKSSHVIPSLIKKFIKAKVDGKKFIEVWGTGTATREFLYVEDAAEGILRAAEKFDKEDPVNLGAGFEISIKELANIIKSLTEYEGDLIWDKQKPDGQPRRKLDVSFAKKEFDFSANTNFKRGLIQTLDWFSKRKLDPYSLLAGFEELYPETFKTMEMLGVHPHPSKKKKLINYYTGKTWNEYFDNIGRHSLAVANAAAIIARALNIEGLDKYSVNEVIEKALTEDLNKVFEIIRFKHHLYLENKNKTKTAFLDDLYSSEAYEITEDIFIKSGISPSVAKVLRRSGNDSGHNSINSFLKKDTSNKGEVKLTRDDWVRKIVHLADDMTASTFLAERKIEFNIYVTPMQKLHFLNFRKKYPWLYRQGFGYDDKGKVVKVENVKKDSNKKLSNVNSLAHYQVYLSNAICSEIKQILDPKDPLPPQFFIKNILNRNRYGH